MQIVLGLECVSCQQATVLPRLRTFPTRSQPMLKEAIAFSVAFFFPLNFILKFYLYLEKLMNLQRSVCTILIKDYF